VKTSSAGVKLIIFMVVTSLMTFTLAATIGNFGGGNSTTYHAEFTDVTGLLPGNEVRIAGVRVGKVKKVTLAKLGKKPCDDTDQMADVELQLNDGQKIRHGNTVQIKYRNLVGERYLSIAEGEGSGTPLANGATVCSKDTKPALDLTVLFNGFRPLFQALDPKSVNDVSYEIVQTLQGEGSTVDDLLAHTASLTSTLADKDAVIGRVVDNLTSVLDTIDRRDTDLNSLITELQRLAKGFAQDRTSIGQSIAGISDLTTATSGLLRDIRPGVRTDIGQLRLLAGNLAAGKDTINGVLQRLPDKLNRIVSTATYGGWFNFYLCGLRLTAPNPAGGTPVTVTSLVNTAARCQQ
jgi:phospholipid/cholesterol/gamma-HCH transport system substrate-binding protein